MFANLEQVHTFLLLHLLFSARNLFEPPRDPSSNAVATNDAYYASRGSSFLLFRYDIYSFGLVIHRSPFNEHVKAHQ
ncbi:hypothetical protein F5878DRAFT_381972 [Lentinula raphanica]|uniref:Secreted protein n=1 Tax=Lentinula raphanica TaxID=153919 RepID=A0AA38P089_9AGAR|nr:hypothetical protein F5878DRAFT_381972 [Lentinula raphanica]